MSDDDTVDARPDFEAFYRAAWAPCLRTVLATTGETANAEDCTAEAFARALQDWHSVGLHPAPAAWVVRTAVNLQRDTWRRSRRFSRLAPRLADDATSELRLDLSVEQSVDPAVLAALRRLPARQREVVALAVLLELPSPAIADHLGISADSARTHLRRAMASLRAALIPPHDAVPDSPAPSGGHTHHALPPSSRMGFSR